MPEEIIQAAEPAINTNITDAAHITGLAMFMFF